MSITIIYVVVCVIFISIQFVSLVGIFIPQKSEERPELLPKVSLLLAARNEEKLIQRSLESIHHLNYPSDKLEVLIGNDNSTDRTAEIVEQFIADKPNFTLHHIKKNLGKGRGKANVLAHLAQKASGEFFFITDVDVALPENWIRSLLAEFKEDVGIVSGTSTCEAKSSWFSKMQSIDWLHFMGYIQSFANLGVSCTSVGNNMAVRAKAYWDTGGYEEIAFSITEDYKLFESVTNRGWDWRTQWSSDSLGLATSIDSIGEMLHQRKRWLIGAADLPLNWKLMLVLYGLFVPALIVMATQNLELALMVWSLKALLQVFYIQSLHNLIRLKPQSLLYLVAYEFYVLLNTLATAVFYFLPIKNVWKGRVYKHNDLI